MTDSELISALKENEYDTELIICDTEGNEFDIEEISMTMGGQFHQVIKLKRCPKEDNWFRTLEQSIEDLEKKIAYYESDEFIKNCKHTDNPEFIIDFYKEKEIPHMKHCLKIYKEKLKKNGKIQTA